MHHFVIVSSGQSNLIIFQSQRTVFKIPRTTVTGQLGEGIWDRTNQTGQPGQVNLDRLA